MSGDASLGYWYSETIHDYPHHLNNNGINNDESLAVSESDGRRGNRSLETRHSSYRNNLVYHSSDNGRGGSKSQETDHSFYRNF